jgi:hypothetical protein
MTPDLITVAALLGIALAAIGGIRALWRERE